MCKFTYSAKVVGRSDSVCDELLFCSSHAYGYAAKASRKRCIVEAIEDDVRDARVWQLIHRHAEALSV